MIGLVVGHRSRFGETMELALAAFVRRDKGLSVGWCSWDLMSDSNEGQPYGGRFEKELGRGTGCI